jgi:hypothetical protein
MHKFERKMKEAAKAGIRFSESQLTYIRCARINGIDVVDGMYERYSKEYINHEYDDEATDYLRVLSVILSVIEACDENLCELIDQVIEENRRHPVKE